MKIRLGDLRRVFREEVQALSVDETDDRMLGDDKGPGVPDPRTEDMSDHLLDDSDGRSLGSPAARTESVNLPVWFQEDLQEFFLQEADATAGFYPPFDMTKDHTGTDDLSATWYRSPGREPGGDGDPFRGSDPHSQLGFHPPQGAQDPTASHPAVSGEEGVAARRTPAIWQLSAGSDTSKVLGAGAKPDSSGGESGDESETSEAGSESESGDEESSVKDGESEGQK